MSKGFTLLEVLIIVALIGLLSAGGVLVVSTQQKRARDGIRIENVRLVQSRIEEYFIDLGVYPTSITFGGSLVSPDGSTSYLSLIPKDPLSAGEQQFTYHATPAAAPQTYDLCAYRLELTKNSYCISNLQ